MFLLVSFLSFAQTQLPDSIILVDGRKTTCLIKAIGDSRIQFVYNNGVEESIVIDALKKIYLEKYGDIFIKGSGFTKNTDEINDFVEARYKKLKQDEYLKAELDRINLQKQKQIQVVKEQPQTIVVQQSDFQLPFENQFNKWSFGVLYVPYFSGYLYQIVQTGSNPYYYEMYGSAINQTNLEAQLAYAVMPNLRLTFDAGYTASVQEFNSESHYRNNYDPYYNYDRGNESINGLKRLDFNIGAKYYFQNILTNKVSVYVLAGFGKQFAFATVKDKQLYITPNPDEIIENNEEEFTEEINSPWHFNFGFGAEYFFNESLSLTSNIKVLYSTHSGTFESREINPNYSQSYKREYSLQEFVTRIGLGLNFYF